MAEITQNSFVEGNLHQSVIFQKGRDVVDSEVNEAQDIQRVSLYRVLSDAASGKYGATFQLSPGANNDGFKVTATGPVSPSVNVAAGSLVVDGTIIQLFTSATSTPPAYAGVARTDVLYVQVSESEVVDPSPLAKLGPNSKRKKLALSFGWSVTGLGGVPASSSDEIWKGGTRYYAIASIARSASNISSGNITDLRKILPPTLTAGTIRQSNFQILALMASILETPNGVVQPKTNTLTFDIDPDQSQSRPRVARFRLKRDGASPLIPITIGEVTNPALSGVEAGVVAETADTVFGNRVGAVRFWDSFIEANKANGQPYVELSGSSEGAFALRRAEKSPAQSNNAQSSIIKAINARLCLTIGDGTNTFGDFNGATALTDAITFFSNYTLPGATTLEIHIKPGTYTVNNYTLPANVARLTLRAYGGLTSAIVIQSTSAAAYIFSTTSASLVEAHNITFSSTQANSNIAFQGSGGVWLFDCRLINQQIVLTDPTATNLATSVRGKRAPLRMVRCVVNNTAGVATAGRGVITLMHTTLVGYKNFIEIADCDFSLSTSECLIKVGHTGVITGTRTEYFFHVARCKVWLSTSAVSAGTMTNNVGLVSLDPTGAGGYLTCASPAFEFVDCSVQPLTASAPSAGNTRCLVHLAPKIAGGAMDVPYFRVKGGSWDVGPMGANSVSPIAAGTHDGEVDPWLKEITFENVICDSLDTAAYCASIGSTISASLTIVAMMAVRCLKFRARNFGFLPSPVRLSAVPDVYIAAAVYDIDGMEVAQPTSTTTSAMTEGTSSAPLYRMVIDQLDEASYRYPASVIRNLHITVNGAASASPVTRAVLGLLAGYNLAIEDSSIVSNGVDNTDTGAICGLIFYTNFLEFKVRLRNLRIIDCYQSVRYDPTLSSDIPNDVVFDGCVFKSLNTHAASNAAGNGNPMVCLATFGAFGIGSWRFNHCQWVTRDQVTDPNPANYLLVLGLLFDPGAFGGAGGNGGSGSLMKSHLGMVGCRGTQARFRVVSSATEDAKATFTGNVLGRVRADRAGALALVAEPQAKGLETSRVPAWTIYNDIIGGENLAMLETPLCPSKPSTSP